MELYVKPPVGVTVTWNKGEIKQEISRQLKKYDGLVYTDDQIKDAKADRAKLNKLYKAIDDKRKEVKKQCLAPYETFESEVKEVLALIQEPIDLIGSQLIEYEDVRRKEKQDQIEQFFISKGFQPFVKLEQIFDPKWLNATTSMKSIEQTMTDRMYQISTDLLTLSKLPEFSFEATEVYKSTLDINKAITEAQRMSNIAKAKAEAERQKAEQLAEAKRMAEEKAKQDAQKPYEPIPAVDEDEPVNLPFAEEEAPEIDSEGDWVAFEACLTPVTASMLKAFFSSNGIKFRPIGG